MKFKRNFMLTFILNFNSLIIFIMTPLIMIMIGIIDDVINALLIIPLMLIVLTVLSIFFSIINLITWPFSRKVIYIEKNQISYNNKTLLFTDITNIYFELGTINKTNGGNPCCLTLYKDDTIAMSITHISFIALLVLLKKCKGVPKRLIPKALYKTGIILYSAAILVLLIISIF